MTHISDRAPMDSSLVIFNVDQRRYAVPLSSVERILPADRIRSLRCASRKVFGLVNLSTQSIPVLSLRRHLGLRERKIEPSDRLIVVRCRGRAVALIAEEIEEDLKLPRSGVGLDLISDVDALLDSEEEGHLDRALRRRIRRSKAGRRFEHVAGRRPHRDSGICPAVL